MNQLILATVIGITFPVIPSPVPPPTPPGEVTSLQEGVFYVVTANEPFMLLASPRGLVSILKAQGPATLLGRFVEAPDKVQVRTITEKFFAVVMTAGMGKCELIACPLGTHSENQVIRRRIDVNLGPRPPPVPPVPPLPPVPPPGPAPIPGDGLRVLLVYETAALGKLPRAQAAILFSKEVREYLQTKCPSGPDGVTKEWRIYDKDIDVSGESTTWQTAMTRPRKSVPWLIVSNPAKGGGFEGALPATVEETLTLLKKYGE